MVRCLPCVIIYGTHGSYACVSSAHAVIKVSVLNSVDEPFMDAKGTIYF